MKKTEQFDAQTVDLKDRNLVEASAGTGKTYSVAILVLRLIMEHKIPIERILMVTFTNAAVAELELRIRKFVRSGLRYALDGQQTDREIMKAVDKTGRNAAAVGLKKAVQCLDELSVFTIHAFCQKTISEFTFETNQPFEYEILKNDSDLYRVAVEKFVRERLNTINNSDLFNRVWELLPFEDLTNLLRKQADGIEIFEYPANDKMTIEEVIGNFERKKCDLTDFIESNRDEILRKPTNNLSKVLKEGTVEDFIKKFKSVRDAKNGQISQYFALFQFMTDEFSELDNEITKAAEEAAGFFFNELRREGLKEINRIKEAKGYIAFDDQIKTIHSALGNPDFRRKLSDKYDAVFIDEFQDTDKLQYEIFNTLFPSGKTMFFIGDPKQSIYGWRKADLATYNEARSNVGDRKHTMASNYRSTTKLIEALEYIFKPADGYNIFEDDNIKFEKVIAGSDDPGVMLDNGTEATPVAVRKFDANDFKTNIEFVAGEVLRLLQEDVTIRGKRVKPSDIAILVREGKEGDKVKAALAEYNITSVKRDELKVLKSNEAAQIRHLISAVVNPESGRINRTLYYKHFGFSHEKIRKLDDERNLEIFLNLKKTLASEGIYNMISEFLDVYGIRKKCMNNVLGQRVLSNMTQVAELLHKAEKRYRYSPAELLAWMKRSSSASEDEFEQRIESDEDAVQISTIHKCKGLTYKIVFAPFLSMIPKKKMLEKGKVNDFRKDGKYYLTIDYENLPPEDKELFDRQKEQENRRLIYVALTRAVYKCYISWVPRVYGREKIPVSSSLEQVLNHCNLGINKEFIDYDTIEKESFEKREGTYIPPDGGAGRFEPRENPGIEIKNTFGVHSYSELNSLHYTAPFERTELGTPEDYNQFIFQDLGRGANVGTALHAVFERLDFKNPASWEQTLLDASEYWSNLISQEKLPLFRILLEHVMNASISLVGPDFKLGEITTGDKLPELEFYFSVDRLNKTVINELLSEDTRLGGEVDIEGLMTGSIDLVFRRNGKYYIVDWKSNHLGNSTDNYDMTGMETAMTGSNYHLQYKIYTVALTRWLKSRIPGFDYDTHFGGIIYIFLRGVREGSNTGIYFTRPDRESIEKLDDALKTNTEN